MENITKQKQKCKNSKTKIEWKRVGNIWQWVIYKSPFSSHVLNTNLRMWNDVQGQVWMGFQGLRDQLAYSGSGLYRN